MGRAGHEWVSPPGGLYLSWIGPDLPRSDPAATLAIGAAIHHWLAERWGVATELRWPNDLMVVRSHRARKLAGVLCERIVTSAGGRTIVGVGLNVDAPASAYPPELRESVVQFAELAAEPATVRQLEDDLVRRLAGTFEDLQTPAGAARWIAVARAALFGRGRRVRQDGLEVGRISDVAEDGALALVSASGMTFLRSGGITVEESS